MLTDWHWLNISKNVVVNLWTYLSFLVMILRHHFQAFSEVFTCIMEVISNDRRLIDACHWDMSVFLNYGEYVEQESTADGR